MPYRFRLWIIGMTVAANPVGFGNGDLSALGGSLSRIGRIAEPGFRFRPARGRERPWVRSEINVRSFSGQGCIEMQHEGIGIGTQFGDDEGHALFAIRPEMNATSRESRSSLATTTGAAFLSSHGKRLEEARAPVERIRPLAGFHLGEFRDEFYAFGFKELPPPIALALRSPRPERPWRW